MRRFTFRLEHLLTLRRYKEREWELKLAEITGICLKIRQKIAKIDEKTNLANASRFTIGAKQDYAQLISSELYVVRLVQERKKAVEELAQREKEREEIQKEYLEHSKKRKVLEKLKEKQENSYYDEMQKEEFKNADDINNGAFVRSRREGE
jgi:flagellar FliJ protein